MHMAQLEATAALDELLLEQRALVDTALYPLQENTPLEDLVNHFHSTILALQHQEPSFWQLQVVEYIRSVLKSQIGRCVGDTVAGEQQNPVLIVADAITKVKTSVELESALQQLQKDVEMQITRLKEALHADDKLLRGAGVDKHFLVKFWEKLEETRALQQSEVERGVEQEEQTFESGSFERLSFDEDFNDMSRSAISFPCMEDFPATIRRMQSEDIVERAFGLDELMQIPVVEIIHSGSMFSTACSAIVELFLDTEIRGERCKSAERAKKVIYDLMNQVEDATQFAELFWAVLDFMGAHLETEELYLHRQDVYESTDNRTIAVLDCFRVFHSLLSKTMHHWVYFSADTLAQLLHSTFRLLTTYSKSSTEVETKQMHPLTMLFLIDHHSVRWFKLWLLNAPNSRQLFAALEDSGFVADLLQGLSRVRPLSAFKPVNSSKYGIEKRTIQSALLVLSYICEYQQGRELVSRWQRLPARAYINQRRTAWERPELEIVAAENDSVYRTIQVPVSEEKLHDGLDINYEHLGNKVVDAVVLSVGAFFVTEPKCLQECSEMLYEQWSTSISNSVAAYLHDTALEDVLAVLVKIIETCSADICGETTPASIELEEKNPWFPFRQPKSAVEVCQLVMDSISLRARRGVLNTADLRVAGHRIFRVVLSSKSVAKAAAKMPTSDVVRRVFELCKRSLQLMKCEVESSTEQWSCGSSRLLELIANLAVLPQSLKVASEIGLLEVLWTVCGSLLLQNDNPDFSHLSNCIASALNRSVEGVHIMNGKSSIRVYQQLELPALSFRELLGCLSFSASATRFFSLPGTQETPFQLINELQDSVDFTVALNSPDDEWPELLVSPMRRLQWLRCCLSSHFASSALLSLDRSPIIDFLSKTIAVHKVGFCTSSCQAEDTCCVAFQLILSLVSSLPSMLECSSLLYELKLMGYNEKCSPQRTSFCCDNEILGSCLFLEKQLRYELEVVGGPSEKLPQSELFAFDATRTLYEVSTEEKIPSAFAFTLHKKILRAIQDGVEAGLSTPVDFVLISQASWELVNALEAELAVNPPLATCKPATAFTVIFAKLIYDLIMSKRSRLERPVKPNGVESSGKSVTSFTQSGEEFFPTDSERKLMNRFYKNYAHDLSLESSPTMLHCIIKKFGKVAMDCFPVTVLMLLHPTYNEVEILNFLSLCIASPSAGFLWPRSNDIAEDVVPPAVLIAKAVQNILEKEFPQKTEVLIVMLALQISQAIEQCQCSLLSLVQRWHSQSFWNYFDWENVVLYTYFTALYGAEFQVRVYNMLCRRELKLISSCFQVYVIVAILRHLEPTMRELTSNHNGQSLAPFLTLIRKPIRGFRFSPWRSFLLRLRSEYHEAVETLLFRTGGDVDESDLNRSDSPLTPKVNAFGNSQPSHTFL
ncbi:Protein broad-minded [Phytophthora citrophthora]|uniref:Protein broad-minded n=1 Tax=Phytophthora citrophthora TaxID=4793 RepID=A0AAD9LD27_9STRA|nr:Protein broad-minded [Phytophthora citrophthora]